MGFLDSVAERKVTGWAAAEGRGEPLIIKLLVDDVAVTQMYGNDLRPGTRDEGWHPTGHCGFSFLLDEAQAIAPGSVVRVLAGSDEVELTKSPWTFQPSGAAENT